MRDEIECPLRSVSDAWWDLTAALCWQLTEGEIALLERARDDVSAALASIRFRIPNEEP